MPDKRERDALAEASGIKPDARMTATLTTLHKMAERFKGLQNAAMGPGMLAMLDAMPKPPPEVDRPDLWGAGRELEIARQTSAAVVMAYELERRRAPTEAPAEPSPRRNTGKDTAPRTLTMFEALGRYERDHGITPDMQASTLAHRAAEHASKVGMDGADALDPDGSSMWHAASRLLKGLNGR